MLPEITSFKTEYLCILNNFDMVANQTLDSRTILLKFIVRFLRFSFGVPF
jgi:hypothetical protein